MIELKITKENIENAKLLFNFKKLHNSITDGEGNLAGALGEILVCEYYKGIQQNTYDYDLLIGLEKIDVKTKRYNSKFTPTEKWNLNIPDFNTVQKCDYYCFVGVSSDFNKAFLYGFIKKDDFYQISKFGKKEEIDPNGNGTWNYRADCYNLQISELKTNIY